MLGIKKLDLFIVKSFTLLFTGTFFICLFIFLMQALWMRIDDLVGKGLEMSVLAEFFFYLAISLVPTALPLAILLASLITFGNFGENYELLAMKAAGISLVQVMRPVAILCLLLCGCSFVFQNYIGPKAQVKMYTLLISIKQKSPELDIPEGVFYDQIPGYNLFIKKKDRETGLLHEVMIYNMAEGFENATIIVSDSGRIKLTADKQHLRLTLYKGEMFQPLKGQTAGVKNIPYRRESFSQKEFLIYFNSDFTRAGDDYLKNNYINKNLIQLQSSIDSISIKVDSIGKSYYTELSQQNFAPLVISATDSIQLKEINRSNFDVDSIFEDYKLSKKRELIGRCLTKIESTNSDLIYKSFTISNEDNILRRHQIEWHNKIALSLSCLVFFFIGAPLGAIIRKGGLGMPVVVSIFLFIFYYIIDTTGTKLARDGSWYIWMARWLSTAVLLPLGFFLTYKANKDSVVFNVDTYFNPVMKFLGIRERRNLTRKEVIIHTPDYKQLSVELNQMSTLCANYLSDHRLHKFPNYIHIWNNLEYDQQMVVINNQLNGVIEELSNSASATLIDLVNKYPILSVHAHRSPFNNPWTNRVIGFLIPLGLVYYIRICRYRVRLQVDLKAIININAQLEARIQLINNEHEAI